MPTKPSSDKILWWTKAHSWISINAHLTLILFNPLSFNIFFVPFIFNFLAIYCSWIWFNNFRNSSGFKWRFCELIIFFCRNDSFINVQPVTLAYFTNKRLQHIKRVLFNFFFKLYHYSEAGSWNEKQIIMEAVNYKLYPIHVLPFLMRVVGRDGKAN